jgi:hypothetical protein
MTLTQAALRASFVATLFQLVSCENNDFYQKTVNASMGLPDPNPDHNDDDDDNGTDDGDTIEEIIDNFTQNDDEYGNVDVLWVVDNSGSMANEQASLAANFNTFIDRFLDQDINFKMGIVTTDGRVGFAGVPVANSLSLLTYAHAQNDENAFIANYMNMIQVGINGSGLEKGLYTSKTFFENYASNWLREDAYLAVIYVSDEEDQSADTTASYVNYLQGLKANANKVKAHVIVDVNGSQNNGMTTGGERYKAVANATGGTIHEITSNFGTALDNISEQIVSLSQSFTLSQQPVDGSIQVFVDGVESFDWTYDAQLNAITFDSNSVPDSGADIQVRYQKE